MEKRQDKRDGLSRRTMLKGAAAAGLVSTVGCATVPHPLLAAPRQIIQRENQLPGAPDWQLTFTKVDPATQYRCPWIEGYVSHASIRAGETLDIMVSTNPPG
ncbi:MAG: twin-arginine translocation signal domain-containing protein, partial [Candidatus Hydrogenedentes bacterium]|nr:twin-arginine translocation signal domain-containing protein [Candidatus Hydrogenedentota bacterium]